MTAPSPYAHLPAGSHRRTSCPLCGAQAWLWLVPYTLGKHDAAGAYVSPVGGLGNPCRAGGLRVEAAVALREDRQRLAALLPV